MKFRKIGEQKIDFSNPQKSYGFLRKEWLKHYVLAFTLLSFVIVSILLLFFRIGITGFAVIGLEIQHARQQL